jgi:hypothetical protein
MSITGSNGPDYMIEASTNLIDWQPIWTTNPPVLPFLYTDTNSPAFPNRFYRIRLGP